MSNSFRTLRARAHTHTHTHERSLFAARTFFLSVLARFTLGRFDVDDTGLVHSADAQRLLLFLGFDLYDVADHMMQPFYSPAGPGFLSVPSPGSSDRRLEAGSHPQRRKYHEQARTYKGYSVVVSKPMF